jgi:large subunit ribosomal protein L33
MRESFMLKCTVCGEENYLASKNRRTKPEKMELKKFCSRCNKNTAHKERK